MTIQDILDELKQEKTASAEAELAKKLMADETPVEKTAKAETVEPTEPTPVAQEEKVAEEAPETSPVVPTMEQADEIGRAIARAYFDELQALGVHGATNYPAPQPGTGGTMADQHPHPVQAYPSEAEMAMAKQANDTSDGNAETIISNLYSKYFA